MNELWHAKLSATWELRDRRRKQKPEEDAETHSEETACLCVSSLVTTSLSQQRDFITPPTCEVYVQTLRSLRERGCFSSPLVSIFVPLPLYCLQGKTQTSWRSSLKKKRRLISTSRLSNLPTYTYIYREREWERQREVRLTGRKKMTTGRLAATTPS